MQLQGRCVWWIACTLQNTISGHCYTGSACARPCLCTRFDLTFLRRRSSSPWSNWMSYHTSTLVKRQYGRRQVNPHREFSRTILLSGALLCSLHDHIYMDDYDLNFVVPCAWATGKNCIPGQYHESASGHHITLWTTDQSHQAADFAELTDHQKWVQTQMTGPITELGLMVRQVSAAWSENELLVSTL